jgi:hypothetical protein
MTIPMMPGWWDQNKEALESLAQTTTRMINPQFDNQLALMQNIRQNPANIQTVVDTAYLNPQIFAQMYGERGLQQIQQMAQPSAAGRIEQTKRDIFDQPIANQPNTVGVRAAQESLGVPSAAKLRVEETQAATLETNLAETLRNIGRTKDLQAFTDPIELNNARNILAAQQQNPLLANIDVAGLVAKQMDGTMTDQDRQALIALTANPEMERYYYSHLSIATNREQAEFMDDRQQARFQQQFNLSKEQMDRGMYKDARELVQRANANGIPITLSDAVNYLTPGRDEQVTAMGRRAVEQLGAIDQLAGRLRTFQQFADDFARDSKLPNAEAKRGAMTAHAATLSSLMNDAPIEIMTADPDEGLWGKRTAFRLYGRPLTGAEVQGLIRDPNRVPVFEQQALADKTDSPFVVQNKIQQITNDMVMAEANGIFAANPQMKAQLQAMLDVWQNRLSKIQAAQNPPTRGARR